MYFKSVEIENIGPVEYARIEFPAEGGHPKPVIIVGENGTGKSILLSHLVNSLTTGKQEVYEDVEVDQGKVYKYRTPDYIKSGKDFSYSSVEFQADIKVEECQLNRIKTSFESELGYTPARKIWNSIPPNEASILMASFKNHLEATSNFFKKQWCLYFPVNRFEEPAWLNIENLKSKANYSDLKRISRHSNRNMICSSPLKNNKDWLLDLILDRQLFDIKTQMFPFKIAPEAPTVPRQLFAGFSGQTTNIYEAVLQLLRVILRESSNIRLGAGTRKNRQIAVMKNEVVWVPNLFQLSTGEVQLLNLFLSIVRDYDLSEGQFNSLGDIKGVVIIDEIDSHLHTSHQKEVLPELIASFPNVQFIITTHSPLFLMGMEERFGSDKFVIFNMPNGELVAPADFSEFNAAYLAFKETTRYRDEIRMELEQHSKPIVFVEGGYDIRYLTKAAELLNKTDVLTRVQLKYGDGFGNLDKVWKAFDNHISEIVQSMVICLYDCDIDKPNKNKGLIYRRTIPFVADSPINIGIENLFPVDTIQKIEAQCPRFIDTQEEYNQRIRGEIVVRPATKSVNKDEKGNMCDWLCENGTAVDFANFESVFDIIEKIING